MCALRVSAPPASALAARAGCYPSSTLFLQWEEGARDQRLSPRPDNSPKRTVTPRLPQPRRIPRRPVPDIDLRAQHALVHIAPLRLHVTTNHSSPEAQMRLFSRLRLGVLMASVVVATACD